MAELNKIRGLVVGQYGESISLTVVDKNGSTVDISTYTSGITVTFRDPKSLKTVAFTGTFVTDGTDGKVKFTPATGDLDRPGMWEGQIALEKASAVALTRVFEVEIDKAL
jgi:hypothetical protein